MDMPPKKKAPEVAGPSRRTRRPWSRWVVGKAPAEERASLNQFVVPRRPKSLRAPPWRRGTISVLVPTVPYVRWTQIEPARPRALKASTLTNVPARAWHGCLDQVLLLLTYGTVGTKTL